MVVITAIVSEQSDPAALQVSILTNIHDATDQEKIGASIIVAEMQKTAKAFGTAEANDECPYCKETLVIVQRDNGMIRTCPKCGDLE